MHPRRTRLGGCCALASCLISSCSPCSLCRFTARSCDCCALLLALFPCPATCSLARLYCWRLDDWFASREPCVHGNATRRRLSALPSKCTALRCLLHATACSPAVPLVFARMRVPRVAPLLCAVSTGRVPLLLALQLGLWCLPVEVLLLRARAANCNAMPVFCFVSPPSNPSFWRARPSCHARKREFCRPERVGKRRGGGRLRTLRCDGGVAQATAQRCCAVGGVGHELQL